MKNEITDLTPLTETDMTSVSINKNFALRSEETQEIISRKPGLFEKWALLIFLFVIVTVIAGASFVKYPDTIEGSAVLTGKNAPKEILPRQSGRLTGLLLENNRQVKANQVIGWIESTADPEEIMKLSEMLDKGIQLLSGNKPEELSGLFKERMEHLGELQGSYQTFVTAWQQFNDYLVNGYYSNRKRLLLTDILSLQHITEKMMEEKKLKLSDNELAKSTFEMNEYLFNEKVISKEEYRAAKSIYMNKLSAIPQLESGIISQENQVREKRKEIDQLEHDILQQKELFEQALYTLKSGTEDWIIRFVIRSPVDGKLTFVLPLQKNQFLEQGKLIGYVSPADASYYAEIKLAQHNFGKVDTGMDVQLRFDAYPYQEVGFISGRLNYISDISVDSNFLGKVDLPEGLMTTRQKNLPFRSGLKARALVITKDMTLLQRIYYGITKSLEMNN
ncbi:MAG: HlyD family efflux transporter periplasmic adaptor subunit [Chitinophagaceae bacterium]|nr:HlyD family efflux transporter periplasmic adaptor subunit [Chitinophagaceae bacterium]